MNDSLRNSLWIILEEVFDEIQDGAREGESKYEQYRHFLELIWTEFIKKPKSKLIGINCHHVVYSEVFPLYMKLDWHQVYSFMEFITKSLSVVKPKCTKSFIRHTQKSLRNVRAGFALIDFFEQIFVVLWIERFIKRVFI